MRAYPLVLHTLGFRWDVRLRDFETRLPGGISRGFRSGYRGNGRTRKSTLFLSLSRSLYHRSMSKIRNKRSSSESKQGMARAQREPLRKGWHRDRGGVVGTERTICKICQDLRARNSPHGCPECKEFFVPLSLAFGAAAAAAMSMKTVTGGPLYVPEYTSWPSLSSARDCKLVFDVKSAVEVSRGLSPRVGEYT